MPSLPTAIVAGSPGHISHHDTVHALLNPVNAPFVVGSVATGVIGSLPGAGTLGRGYLAINTGLNQRTLFDSGSGWVPGEGTGRGVDASWFAGYDPTGVSDSTAAINAALAFLGDTSAFRGGTLVLPGTPRVTATVVLDMKSITLVGRGWGGDAGPGGSCLVWDGTTGTGPLLRVKRGMVKMRDLRLAVITGKTCTTMIEVAYTGGDSPSPTNMAFDGLLIGGGAVFGAAYLGTFAIGIDVGVGDNAQCDQSSLSNSRIEGYTSVGFRTNHTQNVLWNVWSCSFNGNGVGYDISSRFIVFTLCTFNGPMENEGIVRADGEMRRVECGSEGCKRFIKTIAGGLVIIQGGYHQTSAVTVNAEWMQLDDATCVMEEFGAQDGGDAGNPLIVATGSRVILKNRGSGIVAGAATFDGHLSFATTAGGQYRQVSVEDTTTDWRNEGYHPFTIDATRYDVPGRAHLNVEASMAASFLNSWVDYGAGGQLTKFRKGADGRVMIQGLVKSGTAGLAIFQLPSGYRPTDIVYVTVAELTGGSWGFGLLSIRTNGNVTHEIGGNAAFQLDNISFYPAGV